MLEHAMSRQPKWDWSSHTPRMVELYNHGRSIPEIHKAIQCEGFEPCQRSVYGKFRDMGYPTDPIGRARFFDASFPPSIEPAFDALSSNQFPYSATTEHTESGLHSLSDDDMLVDSTYPWSESPKIRKGGSGSGLKNMEINSEIQGRQPLSGSGSLRHNVPSNTSAEVDPWRSPSFWPPINNTTSQQNWSSTASPFESACAFPTDSMELNGTAYFNFNDSSDQSQITVPESIEEHNSLAPGGSNLSWSGVDVAQCRPLSSDIPSIDLDRNLTSFARDTSPRAQRNSELDTVKPPLPNFMNTTDATGTRNKIRSLFRTKPHGSFYSKKRYPTSQYTHSTEDSGYGSGYTSRLTLADIQRADPQSLSEFNSLYRVACQNLHEPRRKAKCRDIPTCGYCRYSSIHNLGWSSRYLKLEVFLSELRLTEVYDFGALDAAGNTALHYAAAGGASFLHLKALIDAGVDASVANTAGELFIHCLRPLQPFTLEPNDDCLKGDDLINLLVLLQPERVFDWRDNNGQTILHALALKIADTELKGKIFNMFTNAGYHSTFPDRFGRTPLDIAPLHYDCHGQVIDEDPLNLFHKGKEKERVPEELTTEAHRFSPDWRLQHVKQIKSQNVVLEARNNLTHVDPETGDNVLHALSRLKSGNDILLRLEHFNPSDKNIDSHNREGNQILLNLEYFVPRGVDLNLHNLEGSHPLKSFIIDRPLGENETGATISKYLDKILWKDAMERVRNKVNVNMKDREGATALHCAAVHGRPDAVRSLIAAGANVNARSDNGLSVLQAAFNALEEAVTRTDNNEVLVHLLKEVISHLEHAGAVQTPSSFQERGIRKP